MDETSHHPQDDSHRRVREGELYYVRDDAASDGWSIVEIGGVDGGALAAFAVGQLEHAPDGRGAPVRVAEGIHHVREDRAGGATIREGAVGVGLRDLQPLGEGREAALVQAKEVAGEVQGVHHGAMGGHREPGVQALGL